MDADEFFTRFASSSTPDRYLFGVNEFSVRVANEIGVDGFIDDYTSEKNFMEKPVLRLGEVPKSAWVVSCITNARPKTAMQRLGAHGIEKCLDYFAFSRASQGRIRPIPAIEDAGIDYRLNPEKYTWVRSILADDESRKVFDDVLSFRLLGNLDSMKRFDYAAERQYFEDFFSFAGEEVFVDGGGYDGFTSLEFVKRSPHYSKIHFFEPVESAMLAAKDKLKGLDSIVYHSVGLYDRKTTLSFDASAGSASRISDEGTLKIDVVKLDDVVKDRVTFIKLDLEGVEVQALQGMQRHIVEDAPKLAVAVYHHPSDFWRIPQYILGLRSDYAVYLRHYTESWTETVAYFIPKTIPV
ncbi:MAG: FkbM family methyltransferase [Betaproteobacteria bacterium]|nr:FkbM family methyltransferase [Betaproteobacteria bacterium]